MSADDRDDRASGDRTCPMCRRPVVAGAPMLVEHDDVIHAGCHLGLADAGAAVATLLRTRPGQPLCAPCIGRTLGLTSHEAEAGSARLRSLAGFEIRFAVCVGCGGRRQGVRALRGPGPARARLVDRLTRAAGQ